MSKTRFDQLVSDGLLDLSGAAAGQVKFPAAQNPSADPNTLDDYEENTFVVTLGPLTSGSITLTNNTLSYTKVGRKVTVVGEISVASVAAPVGHLRLDGLPFAAGAGASKTAGFAVCADGLAASATGMITGYLAAGASNVLIRKYAAGAHSAMAGDVQGGATFAFNFSYFI